MEYLDCMWSWGTLTPCAYGVPWLHVLMGYLDCMCSWGTLTACAHGVPWLHVLMGYLDWMCSWGTLTACAHGVPWLHVLMGYLGRNGTSKAFTGIWNIMIIVFALSCLLLSASTHYQCLRTQPLFFALAYSFSLVPVWNVFFSSFRSLWAV